MHDNTSVGSREGRAAPSLTCNYVGVPVENVFSCRVVAIVYSNDRSRAAALSATLACV